MIFRAIFIIGMISLALTVLSAITVFSLMELKIVQSGPPPAWIVVWAVVDAWMIVCGGGALLLKELNQ